MDTSDRKDVIAFAAQLLDSPDTVFLKVETTGLRSGDEVVEIAVVEALTGNVLLNSLVKPSRPYVLHDKLKHGLSYDALADAPAITSFDLNTLLYRKHIIVYSDYAARLISQSYAAHDAAFQPEATWHDLMKMYGAYEGIENDYGTGFKWWRFDDALENMHVNNERRNHRALEEAKTIGLLMWQIAYRGDAKTIKTDPLPAPYRADKDEDARLLQDPWVR
jgi:DNA polymerase-3 subunit epsilon